MQTTELRAKKDIPNVSGYKFYAVLQDRTIVEDEVKKDKNNIHSCQYFKQMIGWMPLEFTNKYR